MSRVVMIQLLLVVAIFLGGLNCGLILSGISRGARTRLSLVPPAFASIGMIGLLLFSIVHPEAFGG